MLAAKDVANYFLSLTAEEDDEGISHLKMQKLAYYAQGFHLAMYDKPLFAEKIYAWEHGPVVRALYDEYKGNGDRPLPWPTDGEFDLLKFSADEQDLLNDVYRIYGQFAAWKLRNMTHNEPPWLETPANEEISYASMKEYFKTRLA